MFYPVHAGSFLSEKFLSQYENKLPIFKGPLFEIVYLRTYSRPLYDSKGNFIRRERWPETVQRVVEYIMSLYSGHKTREERIPLAERIYHKIFNLKLLPSMRAMWIGGTEACKAHQEAIFNCSALVIDELECFSEVFHLLLCGVGVGFSVEKEYVSKIPRLFAGKEIKIIDDGPIDKKYRLESTISLDIDWVRQIDIGDSKAGWVEALRKFLDAYLNPDIKIIELDFTSIRPKGERIKTFGGHAPGPEGLKTMFLNIAKVLDTLNIEDGGQLRPIQVMDIINFIGKNVIVGGNRRSSQITLFDYNDEDLINAKSKENRVNNSQRIMSNNSGVFDEEPSEEVLYQYFDRISYNGEPGFYNKKAARLRRPDHPMTNVSNPCLEICLKSRGVCNLSSVVVPSHTDLKDLNESVYLATIIGCHMTNVSMSLPKWEKIQKEDRLLGVSMTGWKDSVWAKQSKANQIEVLKEMRQTAWETADRCSFELRIPRPLLVTCVKPEGTGTLLTCANSPGIHSAYAPYYIRRVSVSDTDPVGKALKYAKVPYVIDPEKPERIIFEFPIKTNTEVNRDNESALSQLDRYLMFMEYYVDHNASCTLTFDPITEKKEIVKAVKRNFDKIVGIAWMPKCDIKTIYPYAAYEEIIEEEYFRRQALMPNLENISELVDKFELNEFFEEEPELDPSCAGGVCPPK